MIKLYTLNYVKNKLELSTKIKLICSFKWSARDRREKKVLKASNNAVRARLQVKIKQTLSIQLEDERRDENKL